MSTLNSKFDILRGWPNGQAIEESYTVASGKTLYEGRLALVVNSSGTTYADEIGTGAPPLMWDNAQAGVVVPVTGIVMVITGNDSNTYDGYWLGKVVTLRGTFTVKLGSTDVVGTIGSGSLVPGGKLSWENTAGADYGKLKAPASGAQFVGVVESIDSAAGTVTVQMNLQ